MRIGRHAKECPSQTGGRGWPVVCILSGLGGQSLIKRFRIIGVITASIVTCNVTVGFAIPLTPFRYQAQAQRHCPGDSVVWLDFRKGIYYSKGQRQYARGFNGNFVCRDEARRSGYRRSLLGLR
jgi:hypothetical protein